MEGRYKNYKTNANNKKNRIERGNLLGGGGGWSVEKTGSKRNDNF